MTTQYYKYDLPDISSSSKTEKTYNFDDKSFKITFQPNFRSDEITMSVVYVDEFNMEYPIDRNIVLYPSIDLFQNISNKYILGKLYLIDKTGNNNPPLYTDLYKNYALYYVIEE